MFFDNFYYDLIDTCVVAENLLGLGALLFKKEAFIFEMKSK